ncbi:hypothetical protein [Sphingomicrobium nitratireducens]|uniref:hypothetical protein n=1 Tax=Sphingomicrobium nitratireducens TaxID=2964666 RepID=UPI002240C4F4|nr:hypothetical protein [Sphingomicrobium nitratireducens]
MRLFLLAPIALLAACGEQAPTGGEEEAAPDTQITELPTPDTDPREEGVRAALASALDEGDNPVPDLAATRVGFADLDGEGGEEALAWLVDPMWCGTGGCSLYVLREAGSGWRILDEIGPSQLPVYALAPGADGWAELGVTVYGGGMPEALMAVPHDASGYAANPTVDPARPASADGAKLIIPDLPPPE